MNLVQYIILNTSVEMSAGKAASQAAHAAVLGAMETEAAWRHETDPEKNIYHRWISEGYRKVVLGAPDLFVAERYINNKRFNTFMVVDEGKTEFGGGLTPTALSSLVLDKDHWRTKSAFGEFSLYKGSDTVAEPPRVINLNQNFPPPQKRRWFKR